MEKIGEFLQIIGLFGTYFSVVVLALDGTREAILPVLLVAYICCGLSILGSAISDYCDEERKGK